MRPLSPQRLMKAINAYAETEGYIEHLLEIEGGKSTPLIRVYGRHFLRLRKLIRSNVLNLR